MFLRFIMMLVVVGSLSACSTKDKTSDMTDVSAEQGMVSGTGGTDVYGNPIDGPAPGTQQDLVVNVGDRVFFGFDEYNLTREGQFTLERQAEWLKKYPSVRVTIEGHCDERGTREYNLALGEKRANSVKNYLAALGIDSSRVTTISYGKERPAVIGSNEAAWSQNRRGVTIVE
jgi:peptidoglycan-associated lipoprotein